MTLLDIIVIFGGLIIGWLVVARFFSSKSQAALTAANLRGEKGGPWSVILGVSDNSSIDEIERAYEEKVAETERASPRVMTKIESEFLEKKLAELESAYRDARMERSSQ